MRRALVVGLVLLVGCSSESGEPTVEERMDALDVDAFKLRWVGTYPIGPSFFYRFDVDLAAGTIAGEAITPRQPCDSSGDPWATRRLLDANTPIPASELDRLRMAAATSRVIALSEDECRPLPADAHSVSILLGDERYVYLDTSGGTPPDHCRPFLDEGGLIEATDAAFVAASPSTEQGTFSARYMFSPFVPSDLCAD